MGLDEDQRAVLREAFYMFRDTPGPDGPQGSPGGQISSGPFLTLLRSLGFPVSEGDLESLRYAARGARGGSGPFSYSEVEAAVEALKSRGPRNCDEEIRIVWEALEPRDGLVSVALVQKLLAGPELGGELAAEDLDVLLGHLDGGEGREASETLTFEQFRQLVQPPTPLV